MHDANGRIVHANASGHQMISEASALRAPRGRLSAIDLQTDRALLDSFAAAARGDEALGRKGIAVPFKAGDSIVIGQGNGADLTFPGGTYTGTFTVTKVGVALNQALDRSAIMITERAVIVPAADEQDHIAECLEAILRADDRLPQRWLKRNQPQTRTRHALHRRGDDGDAAPGFDRRDEDRRAIMLLDLAGTERLVLEETGQPFVVFRVFLA